MVTFIIWIAWLLCMDCVETKDLKHRETWRWIAVVFGIAVAGTAVVNRG